MSHGSRSESASRPGAASFRRRSACRLARRHRVALLADLERPGAGQIDNPALMSGAEASRAAFGSKAERAAKDRLERQGREAEKQRLAESAMDAPMAGNSEAEPKPDPTPPMAQRIFLAEAQARLDAAVNAEIGFAERLVWFWSNHFCISAEKTAARPGRYPPERS